MKILLIALLMIGFFRVTAQLNVVPVPADVRLNGGYHVLSQGVQFRYDKQIKNVEKGISFFKKVLRNSYGINNFQKGMAPIMLMSFVWMFITCVGLAILHLKVDLHVWQSGLKLGLLTGICFGVAAISISYLYEKRATGLHFINGGYTLLGNIIAAIIICCWV